LVECADIVEEQSDKLVCKRRRIVSRDDQLLAEHEAKVVRLEAEMSYSPRECPQCFADIARSPATMDVWCDMCGWKMSYLELVASEPRWRATDLHDKSADDLLLEEAMREVEEFLRT